MALQTILPSVNPYPLLKPDDCCETCAQPGMTFYCPTCDPLWALDDVLVITYATMYPDRKDAVGQDRDFLGSRVAWLKGEGIAKAPETKHGRYIASVLYSYLDANWEVIEEKWAPTVMTFVPSHPQRVTERNGMDPVRYVIDRAPADRDRFGIRPYLVKTRNESLPAEGRQPDPSLWGVVDGEDPDDEIILVIDDRFTSGSTMEGIARMLKKEGAGQVYGLAITRSLFRGEDGEEGPYDEVLANGSEHDFDYSICKLRIT